MRRILKRSAERLLGSRTGFAIARKIKPMAGVVLAYHNVVETGSRVRGDHSLHLPLDRFLAQIEWFANEFEVVPLSQLVDRCPDRRPLGAITFDDAYTGALRLALPEVLRQKLPVTLFVCSGWKGGEIPWWDALAGHEGLDESLRHEALTSYAGRESQIMTKTKASDFPTGPLPDDYRIASAEKLQLLATEPEVSIGIHTRTHANLTALSEETLRDELECSLTETRRRYSSTVAWLAYPYGLYEQFVADEARAAGYKGALLVSGGPIRDIQALDRFAVPRVNVPRGATVESLRLRTAGLI